MSVLTRFKDIMAANINAILETARDYLDGKIANISIVLDFSEAYLK